MPRYARTIVPDLPHHVTQRGNRRQPTFLSAFDYQRYRQLLAEQCQKFGVAIWAFCQLPNHVHMILVPATAGDLVRAIGTTHQRYTCAVNRREGWTGHLWQGRFASFPMDEGHLFRTARYILQNPLRAGLVNRLEDWPHSSLRAHLAGKSDGLVEVEGLGSRVLDWSELLGEPCTFPERSRIRRHERSGAPMLQAEL